jgi:O-antigen ligase
MKPLDLAAWAAALLLASSLFAHTVALRLVLLMVGLGLVAAAIAREPRSLRLLPPLWIPILLWAAWATASVSWSLEPARTIRELRSEVGYSMATFWLCFVAAQAHVAVRAFLLTVSAAAIAVCANAFYAFARGTDGWTGGPGNLSSALLILLPCAAAAAWYARRAAWPTAMRLAPIVLAVGAMVAGYTALSRTFWLALAVEIAAMASLLTAQRGAGRTYRRTTVLLATTAVALAAAAMTLYVQTEREALGARSMEEDPRLVLWREVSGKIEQRPLTGYGFGRGMLAVELVDELKLPQLWHAHNLFLDTALQLGAPGVLLLLLLFAATLREGWRRARDPSPEAIACGIAIVAMMAGMLVRNMTDVLLVRQNALVYWGALGVLLAWGAKSRAVAR